MSPLQIAVVAVPLSIKIAILVLRYLTRRNQARNAAANEANRVQLNADGGAPLCVSSPSEAVVNDVVRRYRETH